MSQQPDDPQARLDANGDPMPLIRLDDAHALLVQSFELWFNPEIVRRRAAGRIDETFGLTTAQVVFRVDAPAEIRFNEEVMGVLAVKVDRDVKAGEEISSSEIASYEGMDRDQGDLDAAHITVIYNDGDWVLISDLRFNLARATAQCEAASEFLASARAAAAAGHLRPAADNLYSAVELAAKGALLLLPMERLLEFKKHEAWIVEHNRAAMRGFVPVEGAKLHRKLQKLRRRARYLHGEFRLAPTELNKMLDLATEMVADLEARTAALRRDGSDESQPDPTLDDPGDDSRR